MAESEFHPRQSGPNLTSLPIPLSCVWHTLDSLVTLDNITKQSQTKVSGDPLDTPLRVPFIIFCPLIHWHEQPSSMSCLMANIHATQRNHGVLSGHFICASKALWRQGICDSSINSRISFKIYWSPDRNRQWLHRKWKALNFCQSLKPKWNPTAYVEYG